MGRTLVVAWAVVAIGCGRLGFGSGGSGSDEASALSVGDVGIAYNTATGLPFATDTRAFQHLSYAWTTAEGVTASAASFIVRWVVPRVYSPTGAEVIAVASTDGAATQLELDAATSRGFVPILALPVLPLATTSQRGFDVAFELASGNAIVAYSDGTALPKFRTLPAATQTWSAEAPVFASPPGTGAVSWIELAARPGSDEIALVYSDQTASLWAATWDGTSWGAATLLESNLRAPTWKDFAAAYEATSGGLLVAWGRAYTSGTCCPGFEWSAKPAGQTSFSVPVQDATLLGPGLVALAPELGTDRIAIAALEYSCGGGGCDNFECAIWDGGGIVGINNSIDSAIGSNASSGADNYGGRPGTSPLGVTWLGQSGTAVALWGHTTSTQLDWTSWTQAGGWVVQPAFVTAPAMADKSSIELVDLDDEALAVITDTSGALWAKRFDGSQWHDTESGAALATSVGVLAAQPFGVSSR